jgi:putative tricarboxylic transport membrane protein
MELFQNIFMGFSIVFEPGNFFACFLGVFIGTLVGVLPGIGPVGAMSLLLPVTYHLSPISSLVMLAGIYYGSQYGGSTTAILMNIPGEATSIVSCLDGYKMAQQGRAGPALGIAAFGSFIAGTLSLVGLATIAPPLAIIAIRFGPPEYFGLMCMGLVLVTYLASGSPIRALMMAAFGIILGCIGQDPETGSSRLNFGLIDLFEGIGLVPLAVGLFGISEVFLNIEKSLGKRTFLKTKWRHLLPNKRDWKDSSLPILRGTVLGFFLGILPGGGALLSSFVSYTVEKRISKHPERFGKGAIEGLAGPESANNAATGGAYIPLLTLGIPSNVVMAVFLGALLIQGIIPGPQFMQKQPGIFWSVVASMYLGNGMLLVLNLPLIGLWIQVLRLPSKILFPLITLLCIIGTYSVRNNVFDVALMLIFGVIGYLMQKYNYEPAPMVLAFVLAPLIEDAFRLSLIMSGGNLLIFFVRPIAAGGMIGALVLLILCVIPYLRKKSKTIPAEDIS